MFILRTAFWLGIVITLLPSDKEAQGRLATAANNGIKQISTYCERHETVCENGAVAWTAIKAKAQVAGRMAFDLAMDRLAPQPYQPAAITPPTELAPGHPPVRLGTQAASAQARGTLRGDDLAPRWRADAGRGRL